MRADDNSVFASLNKVAGCRYSRAEYNRDLIDTYILRKAREKGIRLPTGGSPEEYKYLGAKVFQSVAGVSHNVCYVDVGTMYPNLLLALNASPETLVGTRIDLRESPYTESDCVYGYVDTRPVKHLDGSEDGWQQFTGGGYKMVYDPSQSDVKWTCDEGGGPRYEKLYFLDHETQKGFLTECVEELVNLKNQYRGTSLYGSTKRVTNCFTPDTEVMTPDGVVNIRDLDVGDEVYSFNPSTSEVEVKPVTETWEYPHYSGEVIDIQTQHTDLRVTPNHRLYCNSTLWSLEEGTYEVNTAEDLLDRGQFYLPRNFTYNEDNQRGYIDLSNYVDRDRFDVQDDSLVKETGKETDRFIRDDLAARLIGWYVAEGCITDYRRKDYGNSCSIRVTITQTDKTGYRQQILSLLDDIGLSYFDSDYKNISVYNEPVGEFLMQCGEGSENKRLPACVWEFSEKDKELLLESLMNGDGDESRRRYNTVSKSLRDDMLRLSVELGYQPRYSVKEHDDKYDKYLVFPRTTRNIIQSDTLQKGAVDSGVYCVSVKDNETLLAGRNGKFQFVGQSVYGVLGFATECSSFRLFDWRIAEAITLCGRKMIEYSSEYILKQLAKRGYDSAYVALGDTDGCGIAVPSAATRHEALSAIEEAVEQLNGLGYDEFFAETFNVDPQHHHGEIEVESYAPKVFIPSRNPPHDDVGVKKRRIEWQTWDEDDGEIDEIDITGLEAERSDVAPITGHAQELFAETLRMDTSEARGCLFPKLRERAQSIADGEIALSRVCKRGGVGQDISAYGSSSRRAGPLYRGAKYANEHVDGVTIQRGDKPAVVYVTDVGGDYPGFYDTHTAEDGDCVDAVSLLDPQRLPEAFTVDWDKHLRKALLGPLRPLLDTRFGADTWSQIQYGTEQTGLAAFE